MEYAPVRVPAPAPVVKPVETSPVNEGKVCRSPVSGIVVRAVTQAGQTLQVGDVLLILEAMKMENNILAGSKGRITKVHVQAGNSVEKNAKLIEIEIL